MHRIGPPICIERQTTFLDVVIDQRRQHGENPSDLASAFPPVNVYCGVRLCRFPRLSIKKLLEMATSTASTNDSTGSEPSGFTLDKFIALLRAPKTLLSAYFSDVGVSKTLQ